MRVLVVDDSPAIRSLLVARLSAQGHDVDEAPDAEVAMERAATRVPDIVVTDLVMAGLSGVQLCRLLRSDPLTAHVPVVLLTASGDKRSRFWARSAGAAAYVSKDQVDDVVALLSSLAAKRPPSPEPPISPGVVRPAARRSTYERISSILDAALFDSVVAGELRALTSSGELARLFEGLSALLNDVLSYRWVALAAARPYAPLFVHGHPSEREACEQAARTALAAAGDANGKRELCFVDNERATPGDGPPPHIGTVAFAGAPIGKMALAPTARGLSRDDRRMLSLVESELGGPLQMTSLYEDMRRLATTDALTGLLNRRAFIEAVERERARSDRHAYPLSLLLLDIDHFKRINDEYGHAGGDIVLQGVARVLESVGRRSDFVARWGGEEFVVALPQTGEAGARVAAERVRRAIAAGIHKIPLGRPPPAENGGGRHEADFPPPQVTASIGVASAEAPWSMDTLIGAADEAMYSAKARGRNRVESAPKRLAAADADAATHGVASGSSSGAAGSGAAGSGAAGSGIEGAEPAPSRSQ